MGPLLSLGTSLVVYNRSPLPRRRWDGEGARVVMTPRDAARDVEVLITMLADDEAVTSAMLGEVRSDSGPRQEVRPLRDEHGERCALEAAGARPRRGRQLYAAATVMGRAESARSGTLVIVAAGPEVAARALPADLRHPLEADGSRRASSRAANVIKARRQRGAGDDPRVAGRGVRAGGELRCRRPAVPRGAQRRRC